MKKNILVSLILVVAMLFSGCAPKIGAKASDSKNHAIKAKQCEILKGVEKDPLLKEVFKSCKQQNVAVVFIYEEDIQPEYSKTKKSKKIKIWKDK